VLAVITYLKNAWPRHYTRPRWWRSSPAW